MHCCQKCLMGVHYHMACMYLSGLFCMRFIHFFFKKKKWIKHSSNILYSVYYSLWINLYYIICRLVLLDMKEVFLKICVLKPAQGISEALGSLYNILDEIEDVGSDLPIILFVSIWLYTKVSWKGIIIESLGLGWLYWFWLVCFF